MNKDRLLQLLQEVQDGSIDIEKAASALEELPFADLDFAKIDNHREIRVGYPEVIYGEGKTVEQVVKISEYMHGKLANVLITRATEAMFSGVLTVCPKAKYNVAGRTISVQNTEKEPSKDYICIVAAGTSDLPVVEEAYETAIILGNRVEKVIDVGVAGIHRLFARLDVIRGAKVIIVVAGMEGALASVVGGFGEKTDYCRADEYRLWRKPWRLVRPAIHVEQLCQRRQCCEHR